MIILIFGKQNQLYMDFATKSFRIFLSFCFITCFIKISSIFFQSIGKPIHSMIASILRDMFCFVIFTIGLCRMFENKELGRGIYGILFASPLSDIIAGTVIIVMTIDFFKNLEVEKEENNTLNLVQSIKNIANLFREKVIVVIDMTISEILSYIKRTEKN